MRWALILWPKSFKFWTLILGTGGSIKLIFNSYQFFFQIILVNTRNNNRHIRQENGVRGRWLWYINNTKQVPDNIEEYLTPITIAIWIINDGYRAGKVIKWNNYILSYEDCIKVSNAMYNLYNIKCDVIPIGKTNKYIMSVQEDSIELLSNIVIDYIIPEIKYKVQLLFN